MRHLIVPVLACCSLAAQPALDSQVEARVDRLLRQMTLEQKIDLLGGVNGFYIRAIPKIDLPRLKTSDGPLGPRNDAPSTAMAGGIGLAATWNAALAKDVGAQIGRDARARGVHFMLGPGVNIYRAPMNGRNFEYFGEDPFLASRIAVAYIEGLQAQGVSATVKHFMGNNSEFARHDTDSIIDERTMREIYLPVFEAAVKEAHVGSIMDSYNLLNGAHMSQNADINNRIAKKEWGFDGVMMSDWVSTYDGIAAANGGLDLEMPSGDHLNRRTLLPAIEKGQVTVAAVDDKVRRILRTAVRFGWLDRDQTDLAIPRYNQQAAGVALQGARESMVLLKNANHVLPFDRKKIKSVAVIGPLAYPAVLGAGGSSEVTAFAPISYLAGISDALKDSAKVYYNRGVGTWSHLAGSTVFSTAAANGKPGLTVEKFNNPNFEGPPVSTHVELHMNLKPSRTIAELTDEDIADLLAAGEKESNGSSTRWTGYFDADPSGNFEVFVQSPGESGGYRLFIDGRIVIDDWKIRKAIFDHTTWALSAGTHKVVFERFVPGRPDLFGETLRVGIVPQKAIVEQDAKAIAAKADAVVLAVGFDKDTESEGGDRTFTLPAGQDELIREIAAVNPNTVVVLTAGGAVDARPWLDRVPAFVHAWYPGQAGGQALADILIGNVNPSGRLPISYDRSWEENPAHDSYYPSPGTDRIVYKEGVFVGYRGYDRGHKQPLFPFGFGLSYTDFRYETLTVNANPGGYEVKFNVTNTGKVAGADVAQVYVGDTHSPVARPPKELKAFAKVSLAPGETKTVTVNLDSRAFAYYDTGAKQWRADPGDFDILVGRSAEQIELRGKITLPAFSTR